jgi:hypothetical protein
MARKSVSVRPERFANGELPSSNVVCTPEPRTQMCCDARSGLCSIDVDTLQRNGLIFAGTIDKENAGQK